MPGGLPPVEAESIRLPRRAVLLGALLAAPALLAGCTVAPVYGDPARAEQTLRLAYAEPRNRREQLVYHAIQARLGRTDDPSAPLVTARVSRSNVGLSTSGPQPQRVLRLTAIVTVTGPDGTVLHSISRHADASYATSAQPLATQQAQIDAEERAAGELGEALRLALIGALTQASAAPAAGL